MTTEAITPKQDLLERARAILSQTGPADSARPSACCSTAKQDVCCEPSERPSCCGPESGHSPGCGCQ